MLLFQGTSPEVAKKFAREDPYVTSGLVKRWHVREWTTVVGEDAVIPTRPTPVTLGQETLSKSLNAQGGNRLSQTRGMILRMWRAHSSMDKIGEYVQHATKKVFPTAWKKRSHEFASRKAYRTEQFWLV